MTLCAGGPIRVFFQRSPERMKTTESRRYPSLNISHLQLHKPRRFAQQQPNTKFSWSAVIKDEGEERRERRLRRGAAQRTCPGDGEGMTGVDGRDPNKPGGWMHFHTKACLSFLPGHKEGLSPCDTCWTLMTL